jgi:hypothetical protein
MTTITALWASKHATDDESTFTPSAKYIPAMDCLIYLREDCSYRAVRLNPYTTVLLAPYEDRPVGVKFKGVRQMYERLGSIARSLGCSGKPTLSLVALWELAYAEDGDMHTETAERERQRMLAKRARSELLTDAAPIDEAEATAMAT